MHSSPVDKDMLQSIIRNNKSLSNDLFTQMQQYKLDHPKLDKDHVIDPTQSVNWNRDEVQRRNRSRTGTIGAYTAKINKCSADITQAIMDYIHDEYGFGETIAKIIYRKAYEDGHACGYNEVVSYIDEYADFTQQILDASE